MRGALSRTELEERRHVRPQAHRQCFIDSDYARRHALQSVSRWLVTPYVGWNWGGSANFINFSDFDDEFEQRANFGVSFGWMGAGVIGFEFDFGFTPNFFQNTTGLGQFRDSAIATSRR